MVHQIETDGMVVPSLGFGTFRIEGEQAYDCVRTALEVGYRHIDTAQAYGNEEEVGRAIRDSEVDRDEVFLTTKIHPAKAAPDDVRNSTAESVGKLHTDRVDLLLLHWPSDAAPLEETLAAMTQMVDTGQARAIGVSNFPAALLARAIELAPVVTDQVEHHPYLGVDAIEKVCREHDLFVTAYSPLAKGKVAEDATLTEIGEKHGKSAAQVTLRWLLQRGACAIPKSATPERIAHNFDVFDFELSDDEMARISGLERGERLVDPPSAPDWD